jgi:hypothetical protein
MAYVSLSMSVSNASQPVEACAAWGGGPPRLMQNVVSAPLFSVRGEASEGQASDEAIAMTARMIGVVIERATERRWIDLPPLTL